VYPALHLQSVTLLLDRADVESDGQATHVLLLIAPSAAEYLAPAQETQACVPFVSLYFPAAHATQSEPSCPSYPAMHSVDSVGGTDARAKTQAKITSLRHVLRQRRAPSSCVPISKVRIK